jgi:D-alanine-D-alanine ligase
MKQKILIISGGQSKERPISILTGQEVARELRANGYNVKIHEPNNLLLEKISEFKPKVIFNALHGRFGEDGYIQTILDNTGIPYTHSGAIASSIAMDKIISKKLFIKNKILTPKYISYNYDKPYKILVNIVRNKLGFPVVLKPINEGSSVDVFICAASKLENNLKKLKKNYREILIEEYIPGREIQAAIIGNKKLGAIELKPKRQFYDYQAKYNSKAKTKHIIPINISNQKYKKLMQLALQTHNLLKCKGVTRSDFKYYKGKFYILEVNTQPGMTKLSLVPEISKYKGIKFITLIEMLLEHAKKQKN